jgi:hypothetical protein
LVLYTSAGQPPATGDVLSFGVPGPAATIAHDSGVPSDYIDTKPGQAVTIDATGMVTLDASRANRITSFSSAGPSIGNNAIKPDLVATGDNLFMPAQTFNPLDVPYYSSNGFAFFNGTSFSSPIVGSRRTRETGASGLHGRANQIRAGEHGGAGSRNG